MKLKTANYEIYFYIPLRKKTHCRQAMKRHWLKYAFTCLRISEMWQYFSHSVVSFWYSLTTRFYRDVRFSAFLSWVYWQHLALFVAFSSRHFLPTASRTFSSPSSLPTSGCSFSISLASSSSWARTPNSGDPQGSGRAPPFHLYTLPPLLTRGFKYHLSAGNSQVRMSSLDFTPELNMLMSSCLLGRPRCLLEFKMPRTESQTILPYRWPAAEGGSSSLWVAQSNALESSLTPFLLSHPVFDPLANLIRSTFKICAEVDHFLLFSLLPLWPKPLLPPSWITAVAFNWLLHFCLCPLQFILDTTATMILFKCRSDHVIPLFKISSDFSSCMDRQPKGLVWSVFPSPPLPSLWHLPLSRLLTGSSHTSSLLLLYAPILFLPSHLLFPLPGTPPRCLPGLLPYPLALDWNVQPQWGLLLPMGEKAPYLKLQPYPLHPFSQLYFSQSSSLCNALNINNFPCPPIEGHVHEAGFCFALFTAMPQCLD